MAKLKTLKQKQLPPHPGDVLGERIEKLGISAYHVGTATGTAPPYIYALIHPDARFGGRNRRTISAKQALRLARFFGDAPSYWMNLQSEYDLACEQMDATLIAQLNAIEPLGASAAGAKASKPATTRKSTAKKAARRKAHR